MLIESNNIASHNDDLLKNHKNKFVFTVSEIGDTESIIQKLIDFQIAIPSWALGTGGTRFGRFPGGGEPRSIRRKNRRCRFASCFKQCFWSYFFAYSVGYSNRIIMQLKALAAQHEFKFDAVNSNTFQDQANQEHSYKFGSLQNVNKAVRKQAIAS